eukprot:TRINITY_DN1020_c0_g2_i1.p1 TRINITY_DN1020_c0_g2~~TRINITY_DN1020_c0_g2_i1.p1  ORF type:complete len:384 (+),score=93.81 TRINITY_DN1020_c0_g2_i1:1008-2159(+)
MYGHKPYSKSPWSHPPSSLKQLLSKVDTSKIKEEIEFNFARHRIVSLPNVLKRNPNEVAEMNKQLQEKGWLFLDLNGTPSINDYDSGSKMSDSFPFIQSRLFGELLAFFNQPEIEKKKRIEYEQVVPLKEAFHTLTGSFYDWNSDEKNPKIFSFIYELDQLAMSLASNFFCYVLDISAATLAHRADLPAGFGDQVGMLDIVNYWNEKTTEKSPPLGANTDEVNCVPHFDPGLFSLSFVSTHEGLQLFDPITNTWFGGPVNTKPSQENIGVLWLGDAAVQLSKGKWKPAIHRVVYPAVKSPRFTAWYEMCTVDQVNNDGIDHEYAPGPLSFSNIISGIGSFIVRKKEKPKETAERIKRHFGIPMGKSMRTVDMFSVDDSGDVKK